MSTLTGNLMDLELKLLVDLDELSNLYSPFFYLDIRLNSYMYMYNIYLYYTIMNLELAKFDSVAAEPCAMLFMIVI